MSEVVDYMAHQKVKYEYDTEGRNTRTSFFTFTGTNASVCEISYFIEVGYDSLNRTGYIVYIFIGETGNEESLLYTPIYEGDSSIIISWKIEANSKESYLNFTYDKFGRIKDTRITVGSNTLLRTVYSYETIDSENEAYDPESEEYVTQRINSGRVYSLTNAYNNAAPAGTNTSEKPSAIYRYCYDDNGNITDIYKRYSKIVYTNGYITSSSSEEYRTRYTYDYLNQLIREDNREAGYSYTYDYDDAGNRTSKKVYAFTLGNLGSVLEDYSYTYSSSGWGDRLVYDEGTYSNITYDAIGNPIYIEDSDDPDVYKQLVWTGIDSLLRSQATPATRAEA